MDKFSLYGHIFFIIILFVLSVYSLKGSYQSDKKVENMLHNILYITDNLMCSSYKGTFYCTLCEQSLKYKNQIDIEFHIENIHCICTVCHKRYSTPKKVHDHAMKEHMFPKWSN